jgi:hypothetical protein
LSAITLFAGVRFTGEQDFANGPRLQLLEGRRQRGRCPAGKKVAPFCLITTLSISLNMKQPFDVKVLFIVKIMIGNARGFKIY